MHSPAHSSSSDSAPSGTSMSSHPAASPPEQRRRCIPHRLRPLPNRRDRSCRRRGGPRRAAAPRKRVERVCAGILSDHRHASEDPVDRIQAARNSLSGPPPARRRPRLDSPRRVCRSRPRRQAATTPAGPTSPPRLGQQDPPPGRPEPRWPRTTRPPPEGSRKPRSPPTGGLAVRRGDVEEDVGGGGGVGGVSSHRLGIRDADDTCS
jgi:hypothetical protein